MKRYYLLDFLLTVISLFAAYWLHTNSFIDGDVAWHVEGGQRLLAGGNYLLNVFDDNSLFVFAFYFPVVWLHQLFQFDYAQLIVIYVLTVTAVFLLLIYHILNKVFVDPNRFEHRVIYYTLAYSLIFLPAVSLGQREMVLINFSLPYFLIQVFSTKTPQLKFGKPLYFIVALMASFGVMQNIIFLTVFIAIDITRYFYVKKWAWWQLVFYAAVVCETILAWSLYPEYFGYIIPLLLCYGPGFNSDTLELFLYPYIVWLSLGLSLLQFKQLYRHAEIVLVSLATVMSLAIYLLEQKIWYSHLFPALVFAMLLLALIGLHSWQGIFRDRKIIFNKSVIAICLAVAIFLTMTRNIFLSGMYEYDQFHNPQSLMRIWENYSEKHFKNKKVFYLIANAYQGYTLPIYSKSTSVSPWFNPWFVPYLLQREKYKMGLFCNSDKDTKLFIYLIAKTIATTKPDFIMVNIPKPSVSLQGFTQIFTQSNIIVLLKDYFIYDYFKNNIVYQRKPNIN